MGCCKNAGGTWYTPCVWRVFPTDLIISIEDTGYGPDVLPEAYSFNDLIPQTAPEPFPFSKTLVPFPGFLPSEKPFTLRRLLARPSGWTGWLTEGWFTKGHATHTRQAHANDSPRTPESCRT